MAKYRIPKPHLQTSVITQALSQKSSVKDLSDKELFVISFKHLETTFVIWESLVYLYNRTCTMSV